jgi:hypothetical protein
VERGRLLEGSICGKEREGKLSNAPEILGILDPRETSVTLKGLSILKVAIDNSHPWVGAHAVHITFISRRRPQESSEHHDALSTQAWGKSE